MPRVLVVNNDDDTMSLLKIWLEKKSYQVKYTSSGKNIPHLVREYQPSVVLVDVLQKHVVAEMKSDDETSDVPVILMSGYTLRQEPINLPVDYIIEKPFDLNLLEKKIEELSL